MTLLIIGAGPAGLAAAEAASRDGAPVTIVDENLEAGGQIWRGGPASWQDRRARALWRALSTRAQVRWLHGTRVAAMAGARSLLLEGPLGPLRQDWDQLILCSGARELLLPFPGWTLPGVTGAGGLQALIKSGAPLAGKRVVVAGTGPLLLAAAHTIQQAGASVAALVEHQPRRALLGFLGQLARRHPAKLWQAAGLLRALAAVPMQHGAVVTGAVGQERLLGVTLSNGRVIDCDYLACGFGLVPNLELAGLFGLETAAGRVQVDAAQRSSEPAIWVAGEATGIGGVDKALAEGAIAGLAARGQALPAALLRARTRALAFATLLARSFPPPPLMREVCRPSTIVCRCEDVTAAELAPHRDWRSAKLQTRAGMGPCQGRICGAACQHLFGWEAPGLRQPVFPTQAATLALAASEDRDS
ncbi:FAD/NAD(P)-binding oxidoreductase [Massilia sp. TS11]|uniref:NAD(P)/FAD-dependent oxidoreductase n=1 Tax=Massilia sp. TS11 TaxID=2908003 RepID=UPI001EDBCEEE|nr:FAD/NAD(P)-binding oxidoreductase [Massilia sp. TS11]MCG2583081.1 NAD(P)/FAD-dependent oxidoreductase [Massilia sp. TS11]